MGSTLHKLPPKKNVIFLPIIHYSPHKIWCHNKLSIFNAAINFIIYLLVFQSTQTKIFSTANDVSLGTTEHGRTRTHTHDDSSNYFDALTQLKVIWMNLNCITPYIYTFCIPPWNTEWMWYVVFILLSWIFWILRWYCVKVPGSLSSKLSQFEFQKCNEFNVIFFVFTSFYLYLNIIINI